MSKKIMIYLLIGLIVGATIFYFYHQYRTSNHHQRSTDVESLSENAVATFAGGCFWCSESDFEKTDGVVEVVSGYTGGQTDKPSYDEVSSGKTGHREAVQVFYDPTKVTYAQLLDVFWRHADPTDAGGQFGDRGQQYATAIYYHDAQQKQMAEESKKELERSRVFDQPIVTPIVAFEEFFLAEDYHQDYHTKNPRRYEYYRGGSGRNDYISETWGEALKEAQRHTINDQQQTTNNEQQESANKYQSFQKPSDEALKKELTAMQFKVTQKDGTEKPFDNQYDRNKEEGIYVDIVSGEPLYSSTDKFDSGTGWPSFVKPISTAYVVEKEDRTLFATRTEIRSRYGDNHIGHVFDDGPEDRGGLRYCMNSAAMRFVPVDDLEKEGYGEYRTLFESAQ